MKLFRGCWFAGVLLVVFIFYPISATADTPNNPACSDITDSDKKNLCLAKEEKKETKTGYKNKNHSTYYCSLIKNRDMQTFCFAIASSTKNMCNLIINDKLVKECKSSF